MARERWSAGCSADEWNAKSAHAERAEETRRASSRTVDVAAMLHAVHDDAPFQVVDLVDDSVVPAPGGVQAAEFTDQRLAEAPPALADRAEQCGDGGVSDLSRDLVEMPKPLGRDLDLVHGVRSEMVAEADSLAFGGFSPRFPDGRHEVVVVEDVERFLQGLEVFRTHENERGPTVARDQDALVLSLDAVREL